MATLAEYHLRLPSRHTYRYNDGQFVAWANALLERLSGAGYLPCQTVTYECVVNADGISVDVPVVPFVANNDDDSRDVRWIIEVRNAQNSMQYRFNIQDGAIRLTDVVLPEGEAVLVKCNVAFVPVESFEDELKIGLKYENLADAWFRWKFEEDILASTPETAYWYQRVEDELRRLRAESANRVNKSQGRFLAGFMR